MPVKKWTPEHDAWILEHIKGTKFTDLHKQLNEHFGTSFTYMAVKSHCDKKGFTNDRPRLFGEEGIPPGHVKGWKMVYKSEESKRNSQRGQFKKGHKLNEEKKIGEECVFGKQIYVKVHDDGDFAHNWKLKHHFIYERHHGPVPDGYLVVFLDGNRSNFDPDNLMALPRRATVNFFSHVGYTGNADIDKTNWLLTAVEAETRYLEKCSNS